MSLASEASRPNPPLFSARPKAATSSVDGKALQERLREIAAATPQAIDALEPALRAILEATNAAGGAICLYDQRREMLRLAAEAGLSDEGCRRLRTGRRGDAASWDMPLHGLLNRRAYLIESAAQNRYVPPLVEATPVRTVACLPMYTGSLPVGSLVLVLVAPHSLREADIRKLEPPLHELGRLIEAVRRQASEAPSTAPGAIVGPPGAGESPSDVGEDAAPEPGAPPAPSRDTAALARLERENARLRRELERLGARVAGDEATIAEIDRLRARLAEAEAGAAHEQRVREELEAALGRGASTGQNEMHEAQEAARRAEAARSALAAENNRLAAEVERLRAAVPGGKPSSPDLLAEIDRLRARLAEAEAGAAHEHRAREELEAALERGASTGQDELRRTLEQARQAETARAMLADENMRLAAELDWARHEVARIEPLAATLAQAQDEQARLEAALETALAERAEAAHTHAALEAEGAAAHAAQVEHLKAQLAELEGVAERERRSREALEARGADGVTEWPRELREALDAARAAQEALDVARAELAAARVDVAGRDAALGTLHDELAEARRELAGTQARERETRAAQQTIVRELEEERTREAELDTRLAERERELGQLRNEWAVDVARVEALAADGEGLRAAVAALQVERDRLAADVEGAAAARARLEEALERGLEEARGRQQDLGRRLAEREGELANLREEYAAEITARASREERLATDGEALRAAVTGLQVERDRLAAEVEGGAAARARLEEALERGLEEARGRAQDLGRQLAERERELERFQAEHPAELSATELAAAAEMPEVAETSDPGGAPHPTAAERPSAEGPSTIVVLDVDRAWEAIGGESELVVIAPEGDIAARLASLRPSHLLVNLACPRALGALAALYGAGLPPGLRVSACIADAAHGRALTLGAIETAARPLDPDAVLGVLERHAARGTRIVTVGEDIDAFVSLRQALTRKGMSVSMAWNAKQAAELLPMVRPAVVVVDLALPPADCTAVIAQLAALDPIPTAVLVMGNGDCVASFASALGDNTNLSRLRPLADTLAHVLRRS